MAAPHSVHDSPDRGPAFARCDHGESGPGPGCGVRHRSLLRGRRLAGLDCDSPLRLVMSCGWVWHRTCNRHGCSPCAARIRRRNTRVVDAGMHVQTSRGRRLWLLTVTAPGSRDHKRWTPAQRYVRGAVRPACDCHDGVELSDWNPAAAACWNRLRTSLSRLAGDIDYYRAAEVQDGSRGGAGRGALHHHVVLATASDLDVDQVQALVLAAGYGCVMDLQTVDRSGMAEVAGYVSKTLAGYVSKSSGSHRLEVPWRADVVDQESGEVRRMHTVPTYRTHSQSGGWGCTVREVLAVQREQARRRAAALAAVVPETLATQQVEPAAMAGVSPPAD
jgi:hypothetical protein